MTTNLHTEQEVGGLKSCPFCGGNNLQNGPLAVICKDCESAARMDRWNTRAPTSRVEGEPLTEPPL